MSAVSQEHFRVVGGWLNDLAVFVAGNSSVEEVRTKLAAMTGLLASKAPAECFTAESLEFCARKFKFMPSYAELWARLQTFERERSKQLAISGPSAAPAFDADVEDSGLPAASKALVGFWIRDFNAGGTPRQLTLSLDVMRSKATDGYRWLINARSDAGMRAADIAVRNHWGDAEHRWTPPSETEKDEVARTVDEVRAGRVEPLPRGVGVSGTVARALTMHTPDPQRPDPTHVPEAEPPPPPASTPPPEHVLARRMDNPLLRPLAERDAARAAEAQLQGHEFDHAPAQPAPVPPAPAPDPDDDDDWVPTFAPHLRVVPKVPRP